MTYEWNLRDEILEISHRWQQVFLAFLLGSILGWGVALLFPTPHRAQSELYVAYNGDAIYRNADDYKNWQFGELEAYVVSNDVLDATLARLRQQDPYWEALTTRDLKPQLRTYWRNAGRWRLVAEWREPERTTQLAQAWTNVTLEKISQAAIHAQEVLSLQAQIDAISRRQVEHHLGAIQIDQILAALETWRDEHGSQQGGQLDILDRWRLQSLAASAAGLLPGELVLLTQFPPAEAAIEPYLAAVNQALVALREQQAIVQRQAEELGAQREALRAQWETESKASHNLTANLTVEPLTAEGLAARPVRLTSQMALVGGVLGLLVWGLLWLARPLRRAGK
jgi:hypothetical protein